METTVNERIRLLADKLYNGNITEMCRALNISVATMSNIVGGRMSKPSFEMITAIIEKTGINASWFITGEGSMLKSEQIPSIKDRLNHFLKEQNIEIRDFCESIDMSFPYFSMMKESLPERYLSNIKEKYPQLNAAWLMAGEGNMLKSEHPTFSTDTIAEGTPLLPIEAWGGSLNGSSIAVLAEQCKKYNIPISNIDYLIPIAGDSMMPDYCPGDIVAIKKVNERAFIEWGKVYVLDTCNGVVIKEVQPSENDGCITCISRNTPTKYKPFEISLNPEYFYGMYAVKGTVRIS